MTLFGGEEPRTPRDQSSSGWERLVSLLLLVICLLLLLSRFSHPHREFLAFFEDDFFYYLVVAKHLAWEGSSTFNGIQLTNGYHPLWLTVIALVVRLLGDGTAFFVALTLLIWLLVCGTYRTLRHTQRLLMLPDALSLPFALYAAVFAATVSRSGMEVSLALFFLAIFWQRMAGTALEEQSPGAACVSGLLGAATVLSRVDSLLIIAVYGFFTLCKPSTPRRQALWKLFWFLVGLFPVALYLLANRLQFGTHLPVSGVAKNMKAGLSPSISTLHNLLEPRLLSVFFTWPAVLLALCFAVNLVRSEQGRQPLTTRKGRVQICVLLHPFLFYTLLSFTSDWPLFHWYLYPLVPLVALLGPDAVGRWFPASLSSRRLLAATAVLLLALSAGLAKAPAWNKFLYQQAFQIQEFSATHPGRYAMGAGAGMPAYLIDSPMIQMEGLTGDVSYLDRLRRREPLEKALRELGVDFYVTMFAHPIGSCFYMREPEEAGPQSPAISGQLCSPPIATFRHPGDLDVMIFDVRDLQVAANKSAAP